MERILEAFGNRIQEYARLKVFPLPRVKSLIAQRLAETSAEYLTEYLVGGEAGDPIEDVEPFRRAQLAAFEMVCGGKHDAIIDVIWQTSIDFNSREIGDTAEEEAIHRATRAIAERVASGGPLRDRRA